MYSIVVYLGFTLKQNPQRNPYFQEDIPKAQQ